MADWSSLGGYGNVSARMPMPVGRTDNTGALGMIMQALLRRAGQAGVTMPQDQPQPAGLLEAGNIDLGARPKVKNKDGSISTVRSMSFGDEQGREILVPTVSDDGRIMSEDEAVDNYYRTGKHLGIFDNPDDATAYAERLHGDQARQYGADDTDRLMAEALGLVRASPWSSLGLRGY